MKTPMQELIEEMRKSPLMYATALTLIDSRKMLQKEELMIMRVYQDGLDNGYSNGNWKLAQYYEETFKTKEK